MWKLNHKEDWALKNWCFQTESPFDCKEIKWVNPNQPWVFIGMTDAEAPMLWPFDANSQLIGKDPDAGENGRSEEKGMTED